MSRRTGGTVRSAVVRGVGLAAGVGCLAAEVLGGASPDLRLDPFRPDRFAAEVS
ncbi:hypothetical protein [Streptomyces sp. MZ04]|uniref:hypothetical protein n=1 Tax=Streptomyces sp. MZ04 TaxID=2559236 RepID=UPI0014329E94|nr:hypothetical protein [Streptomyces sp. MZ04]